MRDTDLKKLAAFVAKLLKKTFPDAAIELDYNKKDPWQLLVVVALSAQTTDKKVNEISPKLFKRFKTVNDFARADPVDIEPYIKSIGLFRNKAKNLVHAAQKIVEDFDGKIPRDRKVLETIPGVGQKTSAVIVANAFNIQAIAVDTHVTRVAYRLGLTRKRDPKKIEEELTNLFKREDLIEVHHELILHGRRICIAKKPKCSICPLESRCEKNGVTISQ